MQVGPWCYYKHYNKTQIHSHVHLTSGVNSGGDVFIQYKSYLLCFIPTWLTVLFCATCIDHLTLSWPVHFQASKGTNLRPLTCETLSSPTWVAFFYKVFLSLCLLLWCFTAIFLSSFVVHRCGADGYWLANGKLLLCGRCGWSNLCMW